MIYCIYRVYKEIGYNIVVNVDWLYIVFFIRMWYSVGYILLIVLKIFLWKCFNVYMFICICYIVVVVVYYMILFFEILF